PAPRCPAPPRLPRGSASIGLPFAHIPPPPGRRPPPRLMSLQYYVRRSPPILKEYAKKSGFNGLLNDPCHFGPASKGSAMSSASSLRAKAFGTKAPGATSPGPAPAEPRGQGGGAKTTVANDV